MIQNTHKSKAQCKRCDINMSGCRACLSWAAPLQPQLGVPRGLPEHLQQVTLASARAPFMSMIQMDRPPGRGWLSSTSYR